MLQWLKEDVHAEESMQDPASAGKMLAALRGADPAAALDELSGWLETLKDGPPRDEKVCSEVLSQTLEAGSAHVAALLTQWAAPPAGKPEARASAWKSATRFLTALSGALHESATVLLKQPSLQTAAAADAARCVLACRMLAKAYLVRYLSVPPKLWRLAYGIHADAEKSGCAATPVRTHASRKTTTDVTQELLRLLMLQVSAPEMMAPEQIEVADRVIEQLGADFTLRASGVADNPFCFDPSVDGPPRRASSHPPAAEAALRYFGPGTGLDALERLYKQMASSKTVEIRALGALGRDIAPHAQISAIRHLRAFWAAESPYQSPARSPATGELEVVHGYAQVWQHLSSTRSGTTELSLAEDGDGPPATPEKWILRDTGGNELGADVPPRSSDWLRSGCVLAVAMNGEERCVGMVRSVHAEPDGRVRANIAILSRDPQMLQLRPLIAKGEETAYSEQAARQFAFAGVRAIILADGSATSQKPNLLLPPEAWKEGRVFEATIAGSASYLRALKLLRRSDDYVRVTFQWVEQS